MQITMRRRDKPIVAISLVEILSLKVPHNATMTSDKQFLDVRYEYRKVHTSANLSVPTMSPNGFEQLTKTKDGVVTFRNTKKMTLARHPRRLTRHL